MIVTCPRCLTKFNFPDENRIAGTEINFRCSRCREEFVFTPYEDMIVSADVISSLSETDADEPATGESPDAFADTVEIELDENFTSFAAQSAGDAESESDDPELELDLDELFPAGNDTSDVAVSAESLESDALSEEDPVGAVVEPAVETDSDVSAESKIKEPPVEKEVINADASESIAEEASSSAIADEIIVESSQVDDPETVTAIKAEPLTASAAPEESDDAVQPTTDAETGTGNFFLLFIGAVLILGLALWVGFSLWQQYALNMGKYLQLVEVSNQRLHLASDRNVIILKGKVANRSPKILTDIKIKGVLVDGSGKIVAEEMTAGGAVYSREELDRMDGRKLARLEKNVVSLLPTGGELPFMVVFYECPDDAGKCYAEISSFHVK